MVPGRCSRWLWPIGVLLLIVGSAYEAVSQEEVGHISSLVRSEQLVTLAKNVPFTGEVAVTPQNIRGIQRPEEQMDELKAVYKKWRAVYRQQKLSDAQIERKLSLRSRQCSTCAVVGSAGALLFGQAYGEEIDSHDCIFRTNDPPTSDYFAERVGSKTHFQHCRWPIAETLHHKSKRAIRNVMMRPLPGFIRGLSRYLDAVLAGNTTMFENLVILHPRVMIRANRWMRSTGMKMPPGAMSPNGIPTIVVASGICKQIDIYGYEPQAWPYHYFHPDHMMDWVSNDTGIAYIWRNKEHLQDMCKTRDTIRHNWSAEHYLLALLHVLSRQKQRRHPVVHWKHDMKFSWKRTHGNHVDPKYLPILQSAAACMPEDFHVPGVSRVVNVDSDNDEDRDT